MASSRKARITMMPKSQYAAYPKRFIIEILEIYKNSPCLWKVKSEEYFDRAKKDRAYNTIIDKLQEVEQFPDRQMAIALFSALRFYYRKQLKLVEKGRKPTLWYFKHLDFLREYLYSNRKNNELDIIVNDNLQMESLEDYENSADLSMQSLSPLSSLNQNATNTIITSIELESPTNSSVDLSCTSPSVRLCQQYEDSILADVEEKPSAQYFDELSKTWAGILRSISSQQQIIAEKLINDIIYEAHMENLNEHSPLHILNILHAYN